MAAGIASTIWTMREWRREVKTKTRIRLLVMSKVEREKRLDEINRKLGIDSEEIKEQEWLKRKLGYKQH